MREAESITVQGGLEDFLDRVGVVRFEMDTKVVDEDDRLDRVGVSGEDFFYGDGKKGAAQRGVLRDPTGLVEGKGEMSSNSDLE